MGQRRGRRFSRFAVLCEQRRAWALDERLHVYLYDGMRFWRHRKRTSGYEIVAGWETPSFGWMHMADCTCNLCSVGESGQPAA